MSAKAKTHKITVTAMLGAVATVLMFLEFPIPFLFPPFVKLDFSELPALLASFSLGPVSGVAVCLIKNLVCCLRSSTGCVGELANFLIGKGVPAKRLTINGLAYDCPVASNETAEGRAQNRRVEIYIAANEQMVREAENGTLK